MWPWGHLALGYLAHAGVLDRSFRRAPAGPAAILLAVSTQLPDLVDKTLAWYVGVLPNGRSLAHSAIVALVVVALVWRLGVARDRRSLSLAFGVGYLGHLLGDALHSLSDGRLDGLAFLAWPVVPAPEPTGPASVWDYFAELWANLLAGDVSAFLAFEFGLTAVALGLWIHHGCPGLAYGWERLRRAVTG